MIDVRITETAICLRAPYERADDCRAIPGGKWKKAWSCWTYPKSPATAARVLDIFGIDADRDGRLAGMAQAIQRASEVKNAEVPLHIPGLKTTPWLHQVRAYQFAMRLDAVLLNMFMGTGKTLSSVAIVANRSKYTLIQCPLSVVPVWPLEFKIHCEKQIDVLALDSGSVAKKKEEAENFIHRCKLKNKPAVVVINYDSAWRDPFASWALKAGFDTAIFDEIHQIKQASGRRSKFCFHLSKVMRYRIGLTGTPMPHSPLDVFAQCRALDAGVFGTSWTRFKARYGIYGGFGGHELRGYQNLEELYSLLNSISFQADKSVVKLPKEKRQVIPVQIGSKAMAIIKSLENDLYAALETGEVTAANVLVRLIRQAQATSGFITQDDGTQVIIDDAKKRALSDILEGLPEREPVVVFSRFHTDLDTIRAVAEKQGRRYAELSGRVNELAQWQAGEMDIIGVQLQSGGVGINLTRACYGIYFSLDFNLGNFEQSLSRINRKGQTRPVTYYFLVGQKTIDQKIIDALSKRKNVVEHVLAGLPGRWEKVGVI